ATWGGAPCSSGCAGRRTYGPERRRVKHARRWPDPREVAASRPAASSERLTSLDGLRGLAAIVVMIHHIVLAAVPVLAAVYVAGAHGALPAWADVLVHSPLHLLWAGEEFVLVFFAL